MFQCWVFFSKKFEILNLQQPKYMKKEASNAKNKNKIISSSKQIWKSNEVHIKCNIKFSDIKLTTIKILSDKLQLLKKTFIQENKH